MAHGCGKIDQYGSAAIGGSFRRDNNDEMTGPNVQYRDLYLGRCMAVHRKPFNVRMAAFLPYERVVGLRLFFAFHHSSPYISVLSQ